MDVLVDHRICRGIPGINAKVYNEQVKLHGRTREAVLETIRICKDRNVLKEYLSNREKEVVTIMMQLFDQEYAMERYGDEREANGKEVGRQEGEKKGILETLFGLVKDGILSLADAAKRANMNVADFEKAYKTFCL